MIPIRLTLSGFLSYRAPVEVDFTGFDLACISGQNGAGKSSLLDAITWALFGEARKTGEALIHAASATAEVDFTFEYEGNQYRIQRSQPRGKTALLEFQILDGTRWRPLTEKSIRATEERIQAILRLDYETFINVSFFLQGKADQFTQQRPGERKRILANILGLERWETYRACASAKRKELEGELQELDGRLKEIQSELAEESVRKEKLAAAEKQQQDLETALKAQEATLEQIKRSSAALEQERKLTETLRQTLERARRESAALQARLAQKQAEREKHSGLMQHAAEVENAHRNWQAARAALETFDALAARFREQEKHRQPFLDQINRKKAALEEEQRSLNKQAAEIKAQTASLVQWEKEINSTQSLLEQASRQVSQREEIRLQLETVRQQLVALNAENTSLKKQMEPLEKRRKNLEETQAGDCPLCGQELSAEHRAASLEQLQTEGKSLGDQFRANSEEIDRLNKENLQAKANLNALTSAESEQTRLTGKLSQLRERLENARQAEARWRTEGEKRLQEVKTLLEESSFEAEARSHLAQIETELAALRYDAAAHAEIRQREQQGRASEAQLRELEAARAALRPLEDEIASLTGQAQTKQRELDEQQAEFKQAQAHLAESERQTPNLNEAEHAFFDLSERRNTLNQEVGMARQRVSVLEGQRAKKIQFESERNARAHVIGRYKSLERAFGKDGVPALLIEQALPQIEEKANELLDRLSGGAMSVRFKTQAEYKNKKRDDLKETLDIIISDPAGTREYEMFSGGEAFRVNFAIRLALSEILARRTGARLQTLVIDEGFGSQDTQGVQRLIEAINTVRGDFAKILIITHLDELKDAFSHRIEVEKTPDGSQVRA